MKIIEKNEGKKINYNLTGTKLDFADGALTLDLARYQQRQPLELYGQGCEQPCGAGEVPDGRIRH